MALIVLPAKLQVKDIQQPFYCGCLYVRFAFYYVYMLFTEGHPDWVNSNMQHTNSWGTKINQLMEG